MFRPTDICLILSVLAMAMFPACHKSSHSSVPGGDDESPQMTLTLLMPVGQYAPRGEGGADGLAKRCIMELYRSGSEIRVKRSVTPLEIGTDGSHELKFPLDAGSYDIYVWLDCVKSSTLTDLYYSAADIRSVGLVTSAYLAGSAGKEALYAYKVGVNHGEGGSAHRLSMQRPLAKYRLVATDLAKYRKMCAEVPDKYPDAADLEFEIRYEYFLPSSFSLSTGRPNDSSQGISYKSVPMPAEGYADDEALEVGCDYIFAPEIDSFVSLTLIIRDRGGGEIGRCEGVRVDCRRGCLTTVTGNFMTSSHSSGGISVDTEWDDDIVIIF